MSRSNFLDRLQQVSPGIVPFMAANTRGGRADITDSGNKGKGIGGGGGIPGSGNGGGNGGGGGRPTSEGAGNNLSFPAYFPDEKPTLRALDSENPTKFRFRSPYNTTAIQDGDKSYYYFAQGLEENVWQAGNQERTDQFAVDYIDIGDALESAPIRVGAKVRFELALYEYTGTGTLKGFSMSLLEGAKGGGKPVKKGPTELQGSRLDSTIWDALNGQDYLGNLESAPSGTTFDSYWASIHTTGMTLSIQKFKDPVTGSSWKPDGDSTWSDDNTWSDDDIEATNLFDANFGPELNIAGKYIIGASDKPFVFTEPGAYIVTFALDDESSIYFDEKTTIGNLLNPALNIDGGTPFGLPEDDLFRVATKGEVTGNNGLAYAIFNM